MTIEFSTQRLSKDLRKAAATLSDDEARFLVDTYYQMQEQRIATAGQVRSIEQAPEREKPEEFKALYKAFAAAHPEIKTPNMKKMFYRSEEYKAFLKECTPVEPHDTIVGFMNEFQHMEDDMKRALEEYVKAKPIGRWMLSIVGIGPVIAAGLIAHIDIRQCPTAGHIWSYAGLIPGVKWEKGQKRPWNAKLKTLCWKIGESFVKTSKKADDVYGHIYVERKEYETTRNEAGLYSTQANEGAMRVAKSTEAYKAYTKGLLPDGHIHSRAKRYAVKMFLSHLHQVWYEMEFGEKPPKPFVISQCGHAHMIEPPNYPME